MSNKKKILRLAVLLITLCLFIGYYINNKEAFSKLRDLSIAQLSVIFLGQAMIFLANVLVLIVFVRFVSKKIHFIDAARVSSYSALVNFFGFLQGGLGVRGVYLKKQFDISMKRYIGMTSMQYVLLFSVSGLLILMGLSLNSDMIFIRIAAIVSVLSCVIAAAAYKIKPDKVIKLYKKIRDISVVFQAKTLSLLLLITVFQLSGSMIAYGTELLAVGAQLSIGGLLIYTGISQFSILIAITPGAIGIREGLLLLVQNQMNLTSQDIILASTIDRVMYFFTLAALVPLALAAKKKIVDIDKKDS